jgi:1,4-alpha-glucan branching enzyme
MGATVYDGGTTFRVWAPFAERVAVAGAFNAWSETATPLAPDAPGYWSADVPGVRAGDEYEFVIVNGHTYWRNDPYARHMTHSAGSSIVHDPAFAWAGDGYRTPAWNDLVIYEIHTGTFNDAPGGAPGDFGGVIAKLPYLRDLGVNAIELMPSMEFATDFSWGYNPAQIFSIESAYGGPDALKRLIQAAHDLGIAVIFDVVYNHLGPADLDLWRFDGWSEHGRGGIYFYNDDRAHTPWGDTRPDYGRPEVRQYLRDNVRMWLEEFRFDGLRWDATAYIRNVDGLNDDPAGDIADGWRLMQELHGEVDARQPWKLSVAEDLRENAWITRRPAAGGAGFDSQWDGRFADTVREVVIPPDDTVRSMASVAAVVARTFDGDACRRVIYTESHDEVANGKARVPQEIWPGNTGSWYARKRSTLGAALVLTAPGIPMLFQGQEFLEDEWFRDVTPLDWSRRDTYAGIVQLYRDLIRLRRNWFDTTRGLQGHHVNVHHVNDGEKMLAFHRWDRGGPRDDVVVVANFTTRSRTGYRVGFPRPGAWKVRLNSDWNGYGADFADQPGFDAEAVPVAWDGMPCSAELGIGAYSVLVLSQE